MLSIWSAILPGGRGGSGQTRWEGPSIGYWEPIKADCTVLNITVVNKTVDPTFRFMPVDHDGKIRDGLLFCPSAMANLIRLKDLYRYRLWVRSYAIRHGIVTPSAVLFCMNPNHYLSVAIWYLFQKEGPLWPGNSCYRQDAGQQRHDR